MTKHFELVENDTMSVEGRTLHRIRAIKNFDGVEEGDIGGYVESSNNLDEYAWVGGNAQVYGNARVFGAARVSGEARVYNNARVCGNAWVGGYADISDNALVCENAQVSEYAWVFENARIYGNARIFGDAKIYGNAFVEKSAWVFGDARIFGDSIISKGLVKRDGEVINITSNGSLYPITIVPKYIQIGKECHTKTAWLRFTDAKIRKIFGVEEIDWWKTWKPILKSICESMNN